MSKQMPSVEFQLATQAEEIAFSTRHLTATLACIAESMEIGSVEADALFAAREYAENITHRIHEHSEALYDYAKIMRSPG